MKRKVLVSGRIKDLVLGPFLRGPLMLQVKVTVLTHADRRGNLQTLDLGLEATAPTKREEERALKNKINK